MSHNHTDISDDNEPFYDDGGDQSIPLPVALMISVAVLSSLGYNATDTGKNKKLQAPFVQAVAAAPAPASAPKLARTEDGCVLYTASRSPACK